MPSPNDAASPLRLSRRSVAALVLFGLLIALTMAWRASADNGLPSPGWQVTATPTTQLLDGQPVSVTIKANSNVAITEVDLQECELGFDYQGHAGDLVPPDNPRNGHCPNSPVSSSADQVVVRSASDGLVAAAQSSAGAAMTFHVGTGTVTWDTPTPGFTLTCDITHPCALVAKLIVNGQTQYSVQQLSFTSSDPIQACGGTASGVLKAEGGDELTDAWASWTRNYCLQATTSGAPSSTAFTGEGTGLTDFSQGAVDLAYGDAGVDPSTGMIQGTSSRQFVPIPIGLNAAVIAVGGGHVPVLGQPKVPYPQLKLTPQEAAGIVGGGVSALQNTSLPYSASLLADNSPFLDTPYWPDGGVQIPSLAGTNVWALTNLLKTDAPSDWVARAPGAAPTPRPATANFTTATPPFSQVDNTYTGRPNLQKTTVGATQSADDGPLWVVTDNASALALGLTPVQLQNTTGQYVAPNAASLTAAVPLMQTNAQGVLLPNVTAAASTTSATGAHTADVQQPYPLTYVVYAIAPAQPLVDSNCVERSSSQALLTSWLKYITGAGQQNLPAGLAPLPSSLQSQATAAIAKVGTAPVTGTCTGLVTSAPGDFGSGTSVSGQNFVAGTPFASNVPNGVPSASAKGVTLAPPNKAGQPLVAIPAFAGHTVPSPFGSIIALLGIVVLMTLAAWITAGGRLAGGRLWAPGALEALDWRRVASLVALWGGVGIVCLALVLFQLGPQLEQRDQHQLLSQYRSSVSTAANETSGLGGITVPKEPPATGTPVGILEIGALKSQDVVVEGVTNVQTSKGPGHVPGTSGLGQSGNAVVVARRNGYGGPFERIDTLRRGNKIVVTTTQGVSVYKVRSVTTKHLTPYQLTSSVTRSHSSTATTTGAASVNSATSPTTTGAASSPGATTTTTTRGAAASPGATTTTTRPSSRYTTHKPKAGVIRTVSLNTLYGPTSDDRLTLVTSSTKTPWNGASATVVVAALMTRPFAFTPQGARSPTETGMTGDRGVLPTVVLSLLFLLGVIVASVALYRKLQFRVAYLLTIAPLVAATVIAGEQIIRLLPAWT